MAASHMRPAHANFDFSQPVLLILMVELGVGVNASGCLLCKRPPAHARWPGLFHASPTLPFHHYHFA